MKKMTFPLNYFSLIYSPVRIFIGRTMLSWGKILFIFIFLNACLILPVSLYFAKADSFQLTKVMPDMMELVNQQLVDQLQAYSLNDGVLSGGHGDIVLDSKDGAAAIILNATEIPKAENAIILGKTEMELRDEQGYAFKVKYTNNTDLKNIETPAALSDWISSQWYIQNKAFLFITMILMTGSILVGSTLMLTLFTSLILWGTKRSTFSSIASYKEAINLTVNALGLPTIVAMITGIIYFDVTIIMAVQSLGMVLMIAFAFFKTRFNHEEALQILNVEGEIG